MCDSPTMESIYGRTRCVPTNESINDNLLRLHIVAVDKTEYIYALGHSRCRNMAGRISTNQHTPHHIHNLQHGTSLGTNNDNIPIVDEGKRRIVAVCVSADGKHQLKPRSIVCSLGSEGLFSAIFSWDFISA